MGQFNDISTIRTGVDRDYYRPVRWNVSVYRRSFSVFVQYFRRVLKNVNNEQVRQPTICDVFVYKHWKEIVGLPLGELEGNRENLPSWVGKRDYGCLPLTIVFWKLRAKVIEHALKPFSKISFVKSHFFKRRWNVSVKGKNSTKIEKQQRAFLPWLQPRPLFISNVTCRSWKWRENEILSSPGSNSASVCRHPPIIIIIFTFFALLVSLPHSYFILS